MRMIVGASFRAVDEWFDSNAASASCAPNRRSW